MGKAARRRRGIESASPRIPVARTEPGDARAEAEAALARLVRLNPPRRVSLAGAYALGYGALGMAQQEGDEPVWFNDLDPLDTLFLGTAWPGRFRDQYEFGNARTAWLRLIRTTAHWRGIERFVATVVQTSDAHQLPIDEGELMLLAAGRLEAAGLDQRKLPTALLPAEALADARFLRGADPRPLPPPPPDTVERIARLRMATDVDLPHDGTPVDAIREGLHRLHRAGLQQIDDHCETLLVALYLSLVASADEPLEPAAERAEAWALGLAADSPLLPVIDTIMAASERGLDADTALGHLFAVPAFAQPVRPEDRRFTSAPGGAFVDLAFELGFRQVLTRASKVLRAGAGTGALLQAQLAAFEEKFGRPPAPDEPIFFDPNADTPQPMTLSSMEVETVKTLQAAGICEAWIHACRQTGGLMPRPDGGFNSDADAEEWQDAVDDYLATHPDQSVDEDAEMRKLRTMMAVHTLALAAERPEFGASLVIRLRDDAETSDVQAEVVAEFLDAAAEALAEFLKDPAAAGRAAELGRSWSGADLAWRINTAVEAEDADLDLDVLLAAAVQHFVTSS